MTYRFSVTPCNFQFLAAFKGSPTAERTAAWRHDYYGSEPDFGSVNGPLEALPRWGWTALEGGSRGMQGSSSALYLLNRLAGPVRFTTRFTVSSSPDFTTLRVRAGSSTLAEIHLDSERKATQVELPSVTVPTGGHHLIFEPFPWVRGSASTTWRSTPSPVPRRTWCWAFPSTSTSATASRRRWVPG